MVGWGEKGLLPVTAQAPERRYSWRMLTLVTLLAIPIVLRCATHLGPFFPGSGFEYLNNAKICPQADVLYPNRHAKLWESLGKDFSQDAFMSRAVEWLGGAVRVP